MSQNRDAGPGGLLPDELSAGQPVRVDLDSACLLACSLPSPLPEPAPNEDRLAAVACPSGHLLLVVADGVGSSRQGYRAARIAVEHLIAVGARVRPDEQSVRAAVLDAIDEADVAIRQQAPGAATTLAVAEIHNQTLRTYHVGDSTVLACTARGRLRAMTVGHSPTERAVEAGWMDHDEALEHDERHIVSNVLGSGHPRIEIGPRVSLAPRDTVLVASDGLFDNLLPAEIAGIIRGSPFDDSFQRLIDETRLRMSAWPERGKPDDLSAIVWRQVSGARAA